MKTPLLALAAAALLAAPMAAAAQPAPGGPAPRPGVERPRMDPAQMAERRAERLRATLQLRPDQEGALKAFLDASRPAGGMGQRMARPRQAPGAQAPGARTAPQRIEQARKAMAERQARFERTAEATLKFYGQLSPAQQKAFDAQRGPGMGGKMRGPGRGHGRG